MSACYSFWLYNRISYGSFSPYLSVTTLLYDIVSTIPSPELSLAFSFLVVPLVGNNIQSGNKPKVTPSGVRAISNQVDNTLIESLDSNKNGLQYHSSESIKNLAQKLEVEDFLTTTTASWLLPAPYGPS